MKKYDELSKTVALLLRHNPNKYGLNIDNKGWVYINDLIKCLKLQFGFKDITCNDLITMSIISTKKRYQIEDEKIRAIYGHSIDLKIEYNKQKPPLTLYHGTARRFVREIEEKGLCAKSRQFVHLSAEYKSAEEIGKRHDMKPRVLVIDAKKAYESGIVFYKADSNIWLVKYLPYEFVIKVVTCS